MHRLRRSARYRAAIYLTSSRGIEPIDDWSLLVTSEAEPSEVTDEKARLALEYRRWLTEVTGGRAYVMWLTAYAAVAEMDGERAHRCLESCTAIIREFVDAPAVDQ